ncbi:hypothetical protein [Deinococcus xianganensis]|uniref:Uncharacterized protein n=1 Tax=Deinococcus xianganensis TaxID=1507289 RepID=A0A6I4YR71_9DEIO|nr:hypothetical protein [Deinococcus xianganensis]MXV21487.1 hypothetical protein [Deinococcus xianganensis]
MDTWFPLVTLVLGVLSVGLYLRAKRITPGAEHLKTSTRRAARWTAPREADAASPGGGAGHGVQLSTGAVDGHGAGADRPGE